MKKLVLLTLSACSTCFAKDLGRQGEVFPIQEEDLLLLFKKKLSEFDMEKYMEEMEDLALHPQALSHITHATSPRSFFVDRGIPEGEEISDTMLFLDGDDASHLAWAREQGEGCLWILVKGDPLALEEKEGREIYFDQMGAFTKQLQIEHVPAKATQERSGMRVEEIAIGQS